MKISVTVSMVERKPRKSDCAKNVRLDVLYCRLKKENQHVPMYKKENTGNGCIKLLNLPSVFHKSVGNTVSLY